MVEHRLGTLHTSLLFKTNKQGRHILAYIIDKGFADTKVILNPLDISNYLFPYIKDAANTVNVKRGIKNLIDLRVLTPADDSQPEVFFVDQGLLKLVPHAVTYGF